MPEGEVVISRMSLQDVSMAVDWARQEGWNPGVNDAELFFGADPNGFFKGKLGNTLVAVGSAVNYDDNFAFCGLYIVAPQYRGRGFGLALTKARLDYCGDRNIGIDGVLENVGIYQNIGYVPYYENHRYQFVAKELPHSALHLKSVEALDFAEIALYDRQCFPAARPEFLSAWIHQADSRFLAYVDNGVLCGFVVRRRCIEGYKLGPLFADTAEIADQLLRAIQSDIAGASVLLDIPEINTQALQIAQHYNMKKIFATARMYQKNQPELADEKIFGITTFELG